MRFKSWRIPTWLIVAWTAISALVAVGDFMSEGSPVSLACLWGQCAGVSLWTWAVVMTPLGLLWYATRPGVSRLRIVLALLAAIAALGMLIAVRQWPEDALASSAGVPVGDTIIIDAPSPMSTDVIPGPAGWLGDLGRYDIHLLSDTTGWLSTESTFYRTDDSGNTWVEVRPPGWSATATVRFVDRDTVYAASDSRPVTIAASHDGGASWVEATIDDASMFGGPILAFQTPAQGSATFYASEGRELRIFETTDGGMTWTGPVSEVPPPGRDSFMKIQGGDGAVQWLSNGKADDKPFDNGLLLSMDGGSTWKSRSFPTGGVALTGSLKWPLGMWADGIGQVVLALTVDGGDQVIYMSDDDGRSWRFIRAWPQPTGADFHVHLLSAAEWVLLAPDGSEVWSTVDGGGSWRRTPGLSKVWLDSTSVISRDRAWAIHRCDGRHLGLVAGPDFYCDGTGVTSVLLATTDGGRTWTQVGE